MGMLVEGLNVIRDLYSDGITQATIGTGTNQETSQDTTLQTSLSITATSITATTTDQYVELAARFPSTSAGGESVTEILWQASDGTGISRVTFAAVTYSTSSDLIITTRWYVKGRR